MRVYKLLIFLFILPLTLFLDLMLYGMLNICPTCGSFSTWLQTEGALSFPIIVGLGGWLSQLLPKLPRLLKS